jgi:hypothetical protein
MNCRLGENCPKQQANARDCPLGDNCHMFPRPRLEGQLANFANDLNGTPNEFSDEALLTDIRQLQSCIKTLITKLG